MLESLFEPIQTEEDDKCVDRDGVGQHWYEEQDELLICGEKIDINRVEPRLCTDSACEE